MELVEGETLLDRLKKGALPLDQTLRYGIEIADALDKAHRQGVVHRDMKPGNVMLTKAGSKLMDFGLAKRGLAGESGGAVSALPTQEKPLTEAGSLLGTFQYMAPEQLEGKDADARADIWALGCVLYEMATGKRAFEGKSQASLISAIMTSEPQPIAQLQPMSPPALDRLAKVCLAKDPDDRLQTAHDVMQELKWIAEAESAAGATLTAPGRRWRERVLGAITGGLAVALVALGAFLLGGRLQRPAEVLRFTIDPEPGTTLSDTTLALSPDARSLVFVAKNAEGKSSLWLRKLDALASHTLAGTELGEQPFWSPDGAFIGFFADGKLKKIPAAGGPVVMLADSPEARGATWNRDGVIVFGAHARGGLLRVAANGGPVTPATKTDSGRLEVSHRWPQFLPDGRHFVYSNLSPRSDIRGLYLGSLGSEATVRMASDVSLIAWSAGGQLLFVRDSAVMTQSLDLGLRQVIGDAAVVAQPAWHDFKDIWGLTALAASGDVLAYRDGGPVRHRLVWLDRSGRELGSAGPEGSYTGIRLSPDGKRVLLAQTSGYGTASLQIQDMVRGTTSRLSVGPDDAVPVWSPDGGRLALSSSRDGHDGIYVRPAVSGAAELERVADGQVIDDWSPDGRLLLFERVTANGKQALWTIEAEGERKPRPYIEADSNEIAGQFSPDGRWVAYGSDESGRYEIYLRAFPVAGERWQVSTGGADWPSWRRDGRELFFFSLSGEMMAAPVRLEGERLRTGAPQALFHTRAPSAPNAGSGSPYAVSADGQRFLFALPIENPADNRIAVVINWAAKSKP
jgi:Tol biopolymer transport system component